MFIVVRNTFNTNGNTLSNCGYIISAAYERMYMYKVPDTFYVDVIRDNVSVL